jgi:hypothetical protein
VLLEFCKQSLDREDSVIVQVDGAAHAKWLFQSKVARAVLRPLLVSLVGAAAVSAFFYCGGNRSRFRNDSPTHR